MDWANIAPMVTGVVLILTTGGVLVLRPLSRRVADLLEVYARDRDAGLERELGHMRDLVETMNARLQLIEERQDFTDRLLTSGDRDRERRPDSTDG
jgi:hypothetical protein